VSNPRGRSAAGASAQNQLDRIVNALPISQLHQNQLTEEEEENAERDQSQDDSNAANNNTDESTTESRQQQLDIQLTYSMAEDNIPLNILKRPRFKEWIQVCIIPFYYSQGNNNFFYFFLSLERHGRIPASFYGKDAKFYVA
jgi:hypothetical protein